MYSQYEPTYCSRRVKYILLGAGSSYLIVLLLIGLIYAVFPNGLLAAEAPEPEVTEPTTQLNLPEKVELRVLITLVSDQLGLQIIFSDDVGNQHVTIKTPNEVPNSSLRGILETVLQFNGFALIEGDQPGWLQIVNAKKLTQISEPLDAESDMPVKPSTAITQVFVMQHADPSVVEGVVEPFLTEGRGSSFALKEHGLLVITDFASNFDRIQSMIELMDRPGREVDIRFLSVRHMSVVEAADEITTIHTAQKKAQGISAPRDLFQIVPQERTNELVLIGPPDILIELEALLDSIDVPLGLETRSYRLTTASASRVDNLSKNLLGETGKSSRYRSIIDEELGLLIVTTTVEAHGQIKAIVTELDSQLTESEPVMRFYKLSNATAEEVLATISEIEGVGGIRVSNQIDTGVETAASNNDADQIRPGTPNSQGEEDKRLFAPQPMGLQTDRSNVVVDPNTNTLIVMAAPAVQAIYQDLIEKLDKRRPQVLIEITLVTLDTSGGFSLGVEYSRSDQGNDERSLTFSSFGLSEVDTSTGSLDIIPGLGFNGTVVSADIADVVVRALSTSGRATVMSAPRILVNDNATGNLTSAADAPYVSVNASNTVSTTSFGGFESAGTTIDVTPHISEGDHLSLEYSVTLSNFGEGGSEGVPPPRQRSELSSEVTVPDGNTVIVGGLNSNNISETIQKVPLLGDIPGLEYLFSSRSSSTSDSTLFVFIRPVILRDDQFKDLKYLSDSALRKAELPSNDPVSLPMMVY